MDAGFPPIAGRDATVLILGSMPSQTSLRETQYYAHPRNRFWPLMANLLGFSPHLDYADRCKQMILHHIAVWDVIAEAERPGSMDASLVADSIRCNDFTGFLQSQPNIRRILCNGSTAYRLFHQQAARDVREAALEVFRLPSTSPANAAWSLERLVEAWRPALGNSRSIADARAARRLS